MKGIEKSHTNGCSGRVHCVTQPARLHKALYSSHLTRDGGRSCSNLEISLANNSIYTIERIRSLEEGTKIDDEVEIRGGRTGMRQKSATAAAGVGSVE